MRKVFRAVVALMLLLSLVSSGAFAESSYPSSLNGSAKIVKYFRTTAQGLKEISAKDYWYLKMYGWDAEMAPKASAASTQSTSLLPKFSLFPWYEYVEKVATRDVCPDLRRRVSKAVYNSTSNLAMFSVGYSHTQSYSITPSIGGSGGAAYGAVSAGVSFTWNESATASETATLQVPPNKYGWWEFEPIMNKSLGNLIKKIGFGRVLTNEYITAYSPHTIYSRLDGVLIAVESSSPPQN